MIEPGTVLTFQPLSVDRMTLPIVKDACAGKGAVDFGDQVGALKLWPGERLRVRCALSTEAMLCDFGRHLLLVLTNDTSPTQTNAHEHQAH